MKNVTTEKVSGYALLIFGIFVIILASFNVYQVFTKKALPIQLFSFPAISLDTSSFIPDELKDTNSKSQTNSSPKAELIPGNILNESSNIFAHLFLMGFIVNVGYKIATLGVYLLRPVEVKVRTKEVPVS